MRHNNTLVYKLIDTNKGCQIKCRDNEEQICGGSEFGYPGYENTYYGSLYLIDETSKLFHFNL